MTLLRYSGWQRRVLGIVPGIAGKAVFLEHLPKLFGSGQRFYSASTPDRFFDNPYTCLRDNGQLPYPNPWPPLLSYT
jgi:hypothetical protein